MTAMAEWLAPVATMIAALMTAANIGARVTGWGFVVFTLGSICWVLVGIDSNQQSLVIANGFLCVVNAIGVWRWLGRQARYEKVGSSAEAAGAAPSLPSVFAATAVAGREIVDETGMRVGEAVEAIVDCETGTIRHIVVRFGGVGGIGEQIVALPLARVRLNTKSIVTQVPANELASLPRLDDDQWPELLDRPVARGGSAPPRA
jgi:sporulation protein YlmC with PRC-barrel domain